MKIETDDYYAEVICYRFGNNFVSQVQKNRFKKENLSKNFTKDLKFMKK